MSRRFVLVILITMTMFTAAYAGGKTKIVVIGVDGATWKVITPLLEKGEMPNLKKLMGRGVYGRIETLIKKPSPVIWTSVATGKVPEKHGIRDFLFKSAADDFETLPRSSMRTTKAIWNIVSEHNKSAGIHNWWATYPAERVNGYVVTDFCQLRPYDIRKDAALVYPSTLRLPPYIYEEYQGQHDSLERFAWDANRLLSQDAAFSDFLFRSNDTDLFMTYTHALDDIQHRFWKFMRPEDCAPDSSFQPDERQRALFAGAIPAMYRAADRWIGELMNNIDKNTIVIILSDHGFEGRKELYVHLEIESMLAAFHLSGQNTLYKENDWVYYLRNEKQDQAVLEFLASITTADGKPVYKITGSDKEGFPIKLEQSELNSTDISIRSLRYDAIKAGFCNPFVLETNGNHDYADGIFVMAGKGIRKGEEVKGVSVLDIAPTVLYLLGLPVGKDMDGKVAVQAIKQGYHEAHPVTYIESYEEKEKKEAQPARKPNGAEEELKQRLRSLGYFQ